MPGGVNDIWSVIVPAAGTNYVTNPSAEIDTTGWTATSGTGGRGVGLGAFGAYGLTFTASAVNGRYATGTLVTTTGTATWTASCYVLSGAAGATLVLRNATDNTDLATAAWATNGARLQATASVPSGKALQVWMRDTRSAAWTQIAFDAVQLEMANAATTYMDGDQPGCTWSGQPHQSGATRSGQDTRGGVITTFETAGLYVSEQPGIGVPPMDVSTQPLALADGSVWTRSVAKDRVFTLAARIFGTGTAAGLHAIRRTIASAFASALGAARGPTVLRYTGSGTTKQVEAHYEGGLDWQQIEGADEVLTLRFRAPDPCWYSETDSSAALDPNNTVTGINNFLWRDRNGTWSNMAGGQSTPAVGLPAEFKLGPNGLLYALGDFQGNLSGASHPYLATWNGTAWSDPTNGAAPDGPILALEFDPSGGFYVGGNFINIAGSSRFNIARWDGSAIQSLAGGTNGAVYGLGFDIGHNLYVQGLYTLAGAVSITKSAYWNGAAFAALGSTTEVIKHLQMGPDAFVYGHSDTKVYVYSSNWISLGQVDASGVIYAMQWRPDGLYVFGAFSTIGGVTAKGAARWRGAAWEALAATATTTAGTGYITGHFGPDGVFHGVTSYSLIDGVRFGATGTQPVPVRWDGSAWMLDDYVLPNNATQPSVWPQPDGTIAVGMQIAAGNGTAVVPGTTTITNNGTAEVFPVISIDGGSGDVNVLTNLTTGKTIRFSNLQRYVNERLIIDLRRGRKTVSSQYRQLIGTVRPGSDLDTWSLVPGSNIIELYCGTTVSGATIHWRQRDWSAD